MFESMQHFVAYTPFVAQLNGGLALGPDEYLSSLRHLDRLPKVFAHLFGPSTYGNRVFSAPEIS